MSYRFVKITTFYRNFLRDYYAANPGITGRSYDEQYSHLMGFAYGWSDYFARHLRSIGVEAFEIVANADGLQHAWAEEHGVRTTGAELIIDQLRIMKPDIILFQDSYKFNGEWVAELRKKLPSLKLLIGWCCAPFNNEHLKLFRAFDCMLVCSPSFEQQFRNAGFRVFQMHHAFEPALLSALNVNNRYPETDFLFLGSFVAGYGFHQIRHDVLKSLFDEGVNLDLYANVEVIPPWDLFLRRSAYIVSSTLKTIGLGSIAASLPGIKKAITLQEMPSNLKHCRLLLAKSKSPVYGLDMFKALSHSKIGFNLHGDIAGEYAANVRLFEVTGVGSCLLTDWKKNLHELFEIDSEIVTYHTAEECVEKVHWLLDHPAERAEIARRGQIRTLRDHNYYNRAVQLDGFIKNLLLRNK